ncbi:MAG TPA: prephenate dehydrogenase [Acidimicrobiales bacterium]|jgi:prephenate dehydrogenase|nr:prephenate dehydrogenase [Acidimicrobiales bacterium]
MSRATIIGTGLIGGSIGLALRRLGWHVTGRDNDHERAQRAVAIGALDEVGTDPDADVIFIATPVGAVADEARQLVSPTAVVTDVGSVKSAIVSAVDHPRFVGGHPMAGSEQEGVEGADADLFEGATWVLTPTAATDPGAYARLQDVVTSLGANVVAMPPERHDALVAVVSHVPHLTAAALMTMASARAEEHAALLRLAAGGFRDMTRIAAGHPGIWPDICAENKDAIVDALDELLSTLTAVRSTVAGADRASLLGLLETARSARVNLPARAVARADEMAEMRVPVPDRPGVLAEVTTLAGELGVNIYDIEVMHSSEGDRGVLLIVIDSKDADLLRGAFLARGYRPSVRPL